MAIDKFQKQLRKELKTGELTYEDASVYTVLLDLVKDTSIDEVFMMLHDVSEDMGKRRVFLRHCDNAFKW